MQGEIIANSLINKAKELECPLYTFAESAALGSGFMILSAGHKAYADPHSLIGGISTSFQGLGLAKVLKNWKINANVITTAETRINPFLELTKQDEKWISEILSSQDKILKEFVSKNRAQVNVFFIQNSESALNGEIFNGTQAAEVGLVDRISDLSTVILEEFPLAQVANLRLKNNSSLSNFWAESFLTFESLEKALMKDSLNEEILRLEARNI